MRDAIVSLIGLTAYVIHQVLSERRATRVAEAINRLTDAIRRLRE